MRVSRRASGDCDRLYVIKSTYDPATRKTSTKIVEKLGRIDEIAGRLGLDAGDEDGVMAWAKARARELTEEEEAGRRPVTLRLRPAARLERDVRRRVGAGYLFPKKVLSELGVRGICAPIAEEHGLGYDLGEVLEALVVARMLHPSSKLSTCRWCEGLVEPPSFSESQVYRALSVLAGHSDEVQAGLYEASSRIRPRRDGVLYYDCTNYFFETSAEDAEGEGDRRYGASKEHRPNPIVEMGLFADADGIPLAFRIWPGNTGEQITMTPLEETIRERFGRSRFVVCTDSGLSSSANRAFNTEGGRAFVTVQSVKKMRAGLREWALGSAGWRRAGSPGEADLREVDPVADRDAVFYKERRVLEGGVEQRYIATFSPKYREYLASVREGQVERARAKAAKGPEAVRRRGQNDPGRFVEVEHFTADGEVADRAVAAFDQARADREARYDGFSCIATSLEDDAPEVIAVNKRRYRIEECFRIMKSEFKARPVYLSRQERIRAHFLTCFVALLVYRLMDDRIGHALTCGELMETLRGMDLLELRGEGWIPAYTRTEETDVVHDAFGFRTDYEVITNRQMRTILSRARDPKVEYTK